MRNILARDLLDAGTYPVAPKDIRSLLERHAPNIGESLDLDDLDAIGVLRVLEYLRHHDVGHGDALAMRRAYKHAIAMRDLV